MGRARAWTRAHLLGNAEVGLNDTVACARAPRRHPRSSATSSGALRVRMVVRRSSDEAITVTSARRGNFALGRKCQGGKT